MLPKYIANGTYGCVLKPPIPCKDKIEIENSITKIFDNKNEKNDEVYTNKKIIKKIDPTNYFTVELKVECDIDLNKYPKVETNKCKNFLEKSNKKYMQIIYEDGGISLDSYMRDNSKPPIKLKYFERLFKGLVELEKNNGSHLDIKPDNIVFNPINNKLCIIDFGLYNKTKDVYSSKLHYLHGHPYYFYPPEFSIYYHRKYVLDNYVTIMNQDRTKKFCNIFNIYLYLYKTNFNDNINKFYNKISTFEDYNNRYSTNGELRKYLDKYANKVDIYMLGITLLIYFSYKTPDYNSNPILCKQIGDLLCNMLNLNIEERYTPQQAYNAFISIIESSSAKKPTSIIKIRSKTIIKPTPIEKPCPPGKIRNPDTKRCRKIIEKKPCPPGKERNPLTNRCRKIKS